jgi:hypothetical protein
MDKTIIRIVLSIMAGLAMFFVVIRHPNEDFVIIAFMEFLIVICFGLCVGLVDYINERREKHKGEAK